MGGGVQVTQWAVVQGGTTGSSSDVAVVAQQVLILNIIFVFSL